MSGLSFEFCPDLYNKNRTAMDEEIGGEYRH